MGRGSHPYELMMMARCTESVCTYDAVRVGPLRSSWDSENLVPGIGCLCEQPPLQTLGTESLRSFPGGQHSTGTVALVAGELTASQGLPGKRRPELVPGFLWTLPHVPSPSAGFALHLFFLHLFTGMSHKHRETVC